MCHALTQGIKTIKTFKQSSTKSTAADKFVYSRKKEDRFCKRQYVKTYKNVVFIYFVFRFLDYQMKYYEV